MARADGWRAMGGRSFPGAVLLLVLIGSAGCVSTEAGARSQAAQPSPPTSAAPASEDLFGVPAPTLVAPGPAPTTTGEHVVPDFCKVTGAGLARHGDGFLLVVRMEGTVPALDQPPALPYGNLLYMLEFNVGVFAPNVTPELGGGYHYVRQYQTPDRPALEVTELGSGKAKSVAIVNAASRDREIRVRLPDAGALTSRVTQYGVSVTCVLRHPVDGFFFPSNRSPAGRFERVPLTTA